MLMFVHFKTELWSFRHWTMHNPQHILNTSSAPDSNVFWMQHHFLKGFGGDLTKAYARASMVATEAVSNIRTVAAFCAEEKVLELFIRELDVPKQRAFVRGQLAGLGYGLSQFCVFSSYGLAMWYSSTLVKNGKYDDFSNIIRTFIVLVVTAVMLAESLTMSPDILRGSQVHTHSNGLM